MNSAEKRLLGVIALFGVLLLVLVPMVHNTSRAWKAKTEESRASLEKSLQEIDSLERQIAAARRPMIAVYEDETGSETSMADSGAVDAGGIVPASAQDCQALLGQIATLRVTQERQDQEIRHMADVLQHLNDQRIAADSQRAIAEENLAMAEAERDRLHAEFQSLEKDRVARFAQIVGVQDAQGTVQQDGLQGQLAKVNSDLEMLRPIHEQLLADVGNLRSVLTKAGVDAASYSEQPLPLEARVTQVAHTQTGQLVSISVGSDQGLRRGHALEAYRKVDRGVSYLGRVEVVEAQRDQAVCKVLPNFQRGVIQEGDRVSSQLQ